MLDVDFRMKTEKQLQEDLVLQGVQLAGYWHHLHHRLLVKQTGWNKLKSFAIS
jgi:hypothetical protein